MPTKAQIQADNEAAILNQTAKGSITRAVIVARLAALLGFTEQEIATLVGLLNAKAPLASPAFTGTPTGINKTHVGLSNVDNTADAAKPVSTSQQQAITAVANAAKDATNITSGTLAAARLPAIVAQKTGPNVTIPTVDLPLATDAELNDLVALLKPKLDALYAQLGGGTTTTVTITSIAFSGSNTALDGSTTENPIIATYSDNSTATITNATTSINETGATISPAGRVVLPTTGAARNVTITANYSNKTVSKVISVTVPTVATNDGGTDVATDPFQGTNYTRTVNTYDNTTVANSAAGVFGLMFPAGVEGAWAEMTMPASTLQNQTGHLVLKATKTAPGGPTYDLPYSFQRRYGKLQIFAANAKQPDTAGIDAVGIPRYYIGTVKNVNNVDEHSVQVQISTDNRATWKTIATMPSGNRNLYLAFFLEAGSSSDSTAKFSIQNLRQKGAVAA